MQGEHQEAVPCALPFHEFDIMRARPTQQFYYARRVCVPWVKAAQMMRDIMRDSVSHIFYYAMRGVLGAKEMTEGWC